MKVGLLGDTLRRVIEERAQVARFMLPAGFDLSRRRLDVCVLSGRGEPMAEFAMPADADGLRGLARRVRGQRVRDVIESMNGARFVHDTLEEAGWQGLVADAKKVNRTRGVLPPALSKSRARGI